MLKWSSAFGNIAAAAVVRVTTEVPLSKTRRPMLLNEILILTSFILKP